MTSRVAAWTRPRRGSPILLRHALDGEIPGYLRPCLRRATGRATRSAEITLYANVFDRVLPHAQERERKEKDMTYREPMVMGKCAPIRRSAAPRPGAAA